MASYGIAKVFTDNSARISCLDFSGEGEFVVTCSEDASIRIYHALLGDTRTTIYSKKYGVSLVKWTHHSSSVIVSSNNQWEHSIRYLSVHDNQYLRQFTGHRDKILSMHYSPSNDTFISSSADKTVRLWDIRTELCQGLLHMPNPSVAGFDPSGLVFATAVQDCVRLYDVRSCDKGPFAVFNINDGQASQNHCVKFSLDGKKLLTTSTSGLIRVLDSYEGTQIQLIKQPLGGTASGKFETSFSPDGSHVISGSPTGAVHMWSTESGAKVAEWKAHNAATHCIQWNPRKWMLASACQHLAFWLPTETSLSQNRSRVGI